MELEGDYFSVQNISTICKKLQITRKRAKKVYFARNSDSTKEKRKEKTYEFTRLMMQGYKFIYIDETGFNDNVC